jgi:hypothetical protein
MHTGKKPAHSKGMRGGKIKMTYQTRNRQKYNTSDLAVQGYYQYEPDQK